MPSEQGRQSRQAITRRTLLSQAARGSVVSGLLRLGGAFGVGGLLAACQTPTSPPRPSDATPVPPRSTPRPTNTPARPASDMKPAALATPLIGPPKPGGALVWTTTANVATLHLDPQTVARPAAPINWTDLVYQNLVMFDAGQRLAPCLAESWAMTSPTTWTFTLRQGVRFHDGAEFEAEDVRAWFETIRTSGSTAPDLSWHSQLARVEPRGRYQVTFTLNAPFAPLLAMLAAPPDGSVIRSRRRMAEHSATTGLMADGSGPFRIVEQEPGVSVTYERHPDYWERGLPHLNSVTVQFQPAESAAPSIGATEQAAASGSGPLTPTTAARLKTDRALTVLSAPGARQVITFLNTRRAPFDDVRVRQALALIADRPAALLTALGGQGALTGPIPTGHGAWALPLESLPTRPDLARAHQLLTEASHSEGFGATIRVSQADAQALRVSQLLAEQVRALGVSLRVEALPAEAFASTTAARDFDLCTASIGFLPDPDAYCSHLYHTNGSRNLTGWSSQTFDDLVNGARTIMDPGQRKARYDSASLLLLDEAPAIWWYTAHTLEAVSSDVKGYGPSFSGGRAALKMAWLVR